MNSTNLEKLAERYLKLFSMFFKAVFYAFCYGTAVIIGVTTVYGLLPQAGKDIMICFVVIGIVVLVTEFSRRIKKGVSLA